MPGSNPLPSFGGTGSVKSRIQNFNTREAEARTAQAAAKIRPLVNSKIPKSLGPTESRTESQKSIQPAAQRIHDVTTEASQSQQHAAPKMHYLHDHPSLRGKVCPHATDSVSHVPGGAKKHSQGDSGSPWGFWANLKTDADPKPAELCNLCRAEAGLEPLHEANEIVTNTLKKSLASTGLSALSQCMDSGNLSHSGVEKAQHVEALHHPHVDVETGKSTAASCRSFVPLFTRHIPSPSTRSTLSMDVFKMKEKPLAPRFTESQFREKVHDAMVEDLTKITRMLDAIILEHSAKLQDVTARLSVELSRLSVDIDSVHVDVGKESFPKPHRTIAQLTPQLHAQSDSFHALIKLVEAATDSWRSDPKGLPDHGQSSKAEHEDQDKNHHSGNELLPNVQDELQVPRQKNLSQQDSSSTYHSASTTPSREEVVQAMVTSTTTETRSGHDQPQSTEQLPVLTTPLHVDDFKSNKEAVRDAGSEASVVHTPQDRSLLAATPNTEGMKQENTVQALAAPATFHTAPASPQIGPTSITTNILPPANVVIFQNAAPPAAPPAAVAENSSNTLALPASTVKPAEPGQVSQVQPVTMSAAGAAEEASTSTVHDHVASPLEHPANMMSL